MTQFVHQNVQRVRLNPGALATNRTQAAERPRATVVMHHIQVEVICVIAHAASLLLCVSAQNELTIRTPTRRSGIVVERFRVGKNDQRRNGRHQVEATKAVGHEVIGCLLQVVIGLRFRNRILLLFGEGDTHVKQRRWAGSPTRRRIDRQLATSGSTFRRHAQTAPVLALLLTFQLRCIGPNVPPRAQVTDGDVIFDGHHFFLNRWQRIGRLPLDLSLLARNRADLNHLLGWIRPLTYL